MGCVVPGFQECCTNNNLEEECLLDENIKAKKGHDVTGSWDEASLYALWTRVSSGTSLFRDVVVASAISAYVFQVLCFMDIF